METEHVMHTFAPVYDKKSRVLILGTFPSVKSRETGLLRPSEKPLLESNGGSMRL